MIPENKKNQRLSLHFSGQVLSNRVFDYTSYNLIATKNRKLTKWQTRRSRTIDILLFQQNKTATIYSYIIHIYDHAYRNSAEI
jgi:hypothetical protein